MKVTIDNREQKRIQSATEYYTKQGLTVNVEELPVGDYIFTDGNKEAIFEFKTVPDFVSSIQDKRVFNQTIEMSENYDYRFVIIHGDEHNRAKSLAMTKHYQRVSVFQYLGAIASINRYCTVIESYNPYIEEAYYRMLTQAKKCLQSKLIVKKLPRKDKNACFNYLAYCVYGVSAKRANEIVTQLELNTLEDLLYLDHNKLTNIDGIGPKLAERILQSISDDTYD